MKMTRTLFFIHSYLEYKINTHVCIFGYKQAACLHINWNMFTVFQISASVLCHVWEKVFLGAKKRCDWTTDGQLATQQTGSIAILTRARPQTKVFVCLFVVE